MVSERVVAVDVLRGLALLGMCVVHMPIFGLGYGWATEAAPDSLRTTDRVALGLQRVFFADRSFPLFGMLFGMGFMLRERAAPQAVGLERVASYRRRLGWLAVIGLLHGSLLFPGDVLLLYSILGVLLLPSRGMSAARSFLVAAILCVAAGGLGAAQTEETAPPVGQLPVWSVDENVTFDQLAGSWRAYRRQFERKAYVDGPYRSTVLVDVWFFSAGIRAGLVSSYGAGVLTFFWAGAALVKLRFFAPHRRKWHVRLSQVGLGLGLPLGLAALCTRASVPGDTPGTFLLNGAGALLTVAGYLGIVPLLVNRHPRAAPVRLAAAAGRMALTNYVLQSVAGTVLFRWYGMGLYGRLSHAALFIIAVAVFLGQAVWSGIWLARFPTGPLERIWRRLARRIP